MLTFNGKTIHGSSGPITFGGPEIPARSVNYWDVVGEAEIVGKPGGRDLFVEHTLHNSYEDPNDLADAIKRLSGMIGDNGDLRQQEGDIDYRFRNCTFRGFDPAVLPGQPFPGPLQDVAGTLKKDNGNADGGWFITYVLRFRQLLVAT